MRTDEDNSRLIRKANGKGQRITREAGKEGAPKGGCIVKAPETCGDEKPARAGVPGRVTEGAGLNKCGIFKGPKDGFPMLRDLVRKGMMRCQ